MLLDFVRAHKECRALLRKLIKASFRYCKVFFLINHNKKCPLIPLECGGYEGEHLHVATNTIKNFEKLHISYVSTSKKIIVDFFVLIHNNLNAGYGFV